MIVTPPKLSKHGRNSAFRLCFPALRQPAADGLQPSIAMWQHRGISICEDIRISQGNTGNTTTCFAARGPMQNRCPSAVAGVQEDTTGTMFSHARPA